MRYNCTSNLTTLSFMRPSRDSSCWCTVHRTLHDAVDCCVVDDEKYSCSCCKFQRKPVDLLARFHYQYDRSEFSHTGRPRFVIYCNSVSSSFLGGSIRVGIKAFSLMIHGTCTVGRLIDWLMKPSHSHSSEKAKRFRLVRRKTTVESCCLILLELSCNNTWLEILTCNQCTECSCSYVAN